MPSTSGLPRLNRRAFVAAAAGAAICAPALAQHSGHGTPSGTALPEATPAADDAPLIDGACSRIGVRMTLAPAAWRRFLR